MHWGAVLANGDAIWAEGVPVQFAPLYGLPLFAHALRAVLAAGACERVYLCVPDGWAERAQAALAGALEEAQAARVRVRQAEGPRTLAALCRAIRGEAGAGGTLLVHDALRPFLRAGQVEEALRAAADGAACTFAVPASRAVLASYEEGYVSGMPDPSTLYFGQMPQAFSIESYLACCEGLMDDGDWVQAEDPCRLFVRNGYPVKLLAGSEDDLCIDRPLAYRAAVAMRGELLHN